MNIQIPRESLNQMNAATMAPLDPKISQKQERIKWKTIKNLDLERIIENNDVITLENYLPLIMNCKISKEEFQKTDKASLAKILQIFQLSLEYFSYTHNYLMNLKGKLTEENTEMEENVKKVYFIYFQSFNS